MSSIDKLTEYFKRFPGIGERQAKRFVYYLLHKDQSYLNELVSLIKEIKSEISQCPSCYVYFQSGGAKSCDICLGVDTDKSILMVVEKDTDYQNIRHSGFYKGLYFILGGLVAPIEKSSNQFVRIKELLKTVEEKAKAKNLNEVILSLSLTPQGEFTEVYLRRELAPLEVKYGFKISSLGRGLSTGLELEYSDPETLKNALKNRQ